MTVFEWHARGIERAATLLGFYVSTTAPERLTWRPQADPASSAHSVLDLAEECVHASLLFAAVLRGEPAPALVRSREGAPFGGDAEAARRHLEASGKELADAVRGMDDAALERAYVLPLGTVPGVVVLDIALSHLQYHAGQVNYIQTLYGDTQFRLPGG